MPTNEGFDVRLIGNRNTKPVAALSNLGGNLLADDKASPVDRG